MKTSINTGFSKSLTSKKGNNMRIWVLKGGKKDEKFMGSQSQKGIMEIPPIERVHTSNNFVGAFDSVGIEVFFAWFGFGHESIDVAGPEELDFPGRQRLIMEVKCGKRRGKM